ncbi:MAG TPA: hypothetical protein VFL69_06875 [Marmoricola sp.]|nr:hypothetical protein [Marmoricola sp.]
MVTHSVETEAGHFDDLHVSAGVRHVRGSAQRVTVTGGATVAVEGVVSGPVSIERGARLCVDGTFSGSVERNEGLLVIAGHATLDLTGRHGRVGIATGSVIHSRERVWVLTDDGTLRPGPDGPRGAGDLAVDPTRLHYFENEPPPVA